MASLLPLRGVFHSPLSHLDKEQPEEADARLWRVSASSGAAAPLGCAIFFTSIEIAVCTPCVWGFLRIRGGVGIVALGVLCMFSERSVLACQNGLFAVF